MSANERERSALRGDRTLETCRAARNFARAGDLSTFGRSQIACALGLKSPSNRIGTKQITPDRKKGGARFARFRSTGRERGQHESDQQKRRARPISERYPRLVIDLACPSCATPADVALGPSGFTRDHDAEPLADGSLGICAGCGAVCVWDRGGCALRIADRSELAALAPRTALRLDAAQKLAEATAHLAR